MTCKEAMAEIKNRIQVRRSEWQARATLARTKPERILCEERAWMLTVSLAIVKEVSEKVTESA